MGCSRRHGPSHLGPKVLAHVQEQDQFWQILTVPVGDVLIGNARSNIKHDDTALAVDVVPITKTSELLLSCGIPNVELDVA